MGKRTRYGTCHICGSEGALSFEHVPPKSAFNDKPIILRKGLDAIKSNPSNWNSRTGSTSQRGGGAYSLCPSCNNKTGKWYGSAYVDWAYQGFRLIEHAEKAPSLYHIFGLYPLRVIKQIYCMFFSVNSLPFSDAHEHLVRFVLNRSHKYTNPSLRVFVYFNTAFARRSAVGGILETHDGGICLFSEVAFPPFGYILAVDGKKPDRRLQEISFFTKYSYNERTQVSLRLPVFQCGTGFPGDFRSSDQILADREANRRS